MRARRSLNTFNLAFIDTMASGLGAVILLFMIIHHATEVRASQRNRAIAEQVSQIETEVLKKRQANKELAAALDATARRLRAARAQAEAMAQQLVADIRATGSGDEDRLAQLQQELRSTQAKIDALRAQQREEGASVRARAGEGRRQYLVGIRVRGNRVLILVDASASMLDETVVGVLRRRNMSEDEQRAAPKWRWAVDAADWLSTQLPATSQFQIYVFNTSAHAVLAGTDGQWLPVGDGSKPGEAIAALRDSVPGQGTSLRNAFAEIARLSPRPDNIYIITDGLPTIGSKPTTGTIGSGERLSLFFQAIRELPSGIPVHTILLPMEGDPEAANAWWQLAYASHGSLLTPSRDWP